MGQLFARLTLMARSFKNITATVFEFIDVINKHNIYLFSASLSYYAALTVAPFLLILLKVGSLLGSREQSELIHQVQFILGNDVAKLTEMIFKNIKSEMSFASLSGIMGVVTVLLSASVIFLQLRFSLDVIMGDYNPNQQKGFKALVVERLFLMFIVIGSAVLFFLSIFVSNIIKYFAGPFLNEAFFGQVLLIALNYLISVLLFIAVYYFVPTHKPKLWHALKMAMFTAFFFLIGKILIALYLENIAGHSVYGAAGSLLVFLIWTYYSSFTIFLSMELFLFFEQKKLKPHLGDGASNLL